VEETEGVLNHLGVSAKGLRFVAGMPLKMKQFGARA